MLSLRSDVFNALAWGQARAECMALTDVERVTTCCRLCQPKLFIKPDHTIHNLYLSFTCYGGGISYFSAYKMIMIKNDQKCWSGHWPTCEGGWENLHLSIRLWFLMPYKGSELNNSCSNHVCMTPLKAAVCDFWAPSGSRGNWLNIMIVFKRVSLKHSLFWPVARSWWKPNKWVSITFSG